MLRFLRKGVLFTLLFAGVVAPAAADPLLMLLLGIARDMVEAHAASGARPPDPDAASEFVPNMALVYPGTTVEPEHLRRLIDDSFVYLSQAQRNEIFASMHEALMNPKNAAVRGAMINYFAEKALTVRAAQQQLAQLTSGEKRSLAAGFRKEITALSPEEQAQLGALLRNGLLPIPNDLNQMLLTAFDAPR
jgi:hypothetical protein